MTLGFPQRLALGGRHMWGLLAAVCLGLWPFALGAATVPPGNAQLREEELFHTARVLALQLEIDPAGMASLRKDRRQTVHATVREGTLIYTNVALHLKGTRGSLRSIDDKPSWTLNFPGASSASRFHGLKKIHLNNAVEDPSYLNQAVGSWLFGAAGLPAPRTTFATVLLGERDLGLYVLQEGYTEEFFAERYPEARMVLFEPGRGQDVDQPLEPKLGDAAGVAREWPRLARAVSLGATPSESRWDALATVLDPDEFLTFMAMEVMSGHRDGYCLARNNFRVGFDQARRRFLFLPHGMDQLLGNPQANLFPSMAGLVAQAVLSTPEGRAAYRRRCGELVSRVFRPDRLVEFIEQQAQRVDLVLPKAGRSAFRKEVSDLVQRVRDRRASLDRQLALPEVHPMEFEKGEAALGGWEARDVPGDGYLDIVEVEQGTKALHLRAGSRTAASWRSRVLLLPGRYRLVGRVRTRGVLPLPFGERQGASIRVADLTLGPIPSRTGTSGWDRLEVDFEVSGEPRSLELVCELRASAGEAWFDLASLRLMKVPN